MRNLFASLLGLLLCLLTHSAVGQAPDLEQIVSVRYKNVPLGKILDEISEKYQLSFSYSRDLIPVKQEITVMYKKQPLRVVLDAIASATDVNYKVVNSKIVWVPKGSTGRSGQFVISGFVEDAETGEKLIGATVANLKTYTGLSTNAYGFYSLTVDTSDVEILFSFVGYKKQVMPLHLTKDLTLNIALESSYELREVVVASDEGKAILQTSQMSQIELSIPEISEQPALTGEIDPMRAMQQYPGVHSGDEGTVSLHVRGGGPDQNLILLDGVPVYNTYHMFGLVSIFNSASINHINLIKAGYPARYGGRLSSVVDARMREGNLKKFGGEASIGLLTAQLTLEGPLKKDTTSFLLSLRRTYADLIATPVLREYNRRNGEDNLWSFNFYDMNAKLNHKFSKKDRLYFSLYTSLDNGLDRRKESTTDTTNNITYSQLDEYKIRWSNFTASLRWNHLFNNRLFANATLLFSDYRFNITEEYLQNEFFPDGSIDTIQSLTVYTSEIRDIGFRFDFNYFPANKHVIQFGGASTLHRFKPGVSAFTGANIELPQTDTFAVPAFEQNLFFEDDISLNKKWKVNLGVHASLYLVDDTSYKNIQPRIAIRYLPKSNLAFKASYSEMTQFLHLLTNAQIGFPVDLWVPPTGKVAPQTAQQVALGMHSFPNEKWEFTTEAYYKLMRNSVVYKNGASFTNPEENWEDQVEVGRTTAYGIEFFAKYKLPRFSIWSSYTLSKTTRFFDNINNGNPFPYKYDRTHDFNISSVYKIKPNISASIAWVFGTGNGITLPQDVFLPANPTSGSQASNLVGFSDRNGSRLPNYHRLDLGVSFTKTKKWGKRIWNFSIYNVYNKRNPYYIFLSTNDSGQPTFKSVSYFPIIPSFRYVAKF